MSIFYIVGKPRGGKSYMAMKAIGQELEDPSSKRNIVTNSCLMWDDYERTYWFIPSWFSVLVWWVLGAWRGLPRPVRERRKKLCRGLKSFVRDYCPHMTLLDLKQRVRVLEDDETGEFWLYEPGWKFENRKSVKLNSRGCVLDLPDFSYQDGSKRGDLNKGNPGTLYVIDEVHLFFPARAWQRTGEDATFFLSQHGKMKCDVVLVTQHPDQCDKALRNLAQEYMQVRNLSREPIFGFRFGSLFRVTRMFNSPKSANPAVFDSRFVSQEWEKYGDLYDTSAGVGIQGTLVPNEDRRGRSLWWAFGAFACFFLVLGYIMLHLHAVSEKFVGATKMVSGALNHSFGFQSKMADLVVPRASAGTNASAIGVNPPAIAAPVVSAGSAPALIAGAADFAPEPVFCVGFCVLGQPVAWLSDGRCVGPDDGLTKITGSYIILDGVRVPVKRALPVVRERRWESSGEETAFRDLPEYRMRPVAPERQGGEIPQVVQSSGVVQILPGIHGQGGTPPPRLSGVNLGQSGSSSQFGGRVYSQ